MNTLWFATSAALAMGSLVFQNVALMIFGLIFAIIGIIAERS